MVNILSQAVDAYSTGNHNYWVMCRTEPKLMKMLSLKRWRGQRAVRADILIGLVALSSQVLVFLSKSFDRDFLTHA